MKKLICSKIKQTLWVLVLGASSGVPAFAKPRWMITQYIARNPVNCVALNVGSEDGVQVDAVLNVFRRPAGPSDESLPLVSTGKIKVQQVEKNTAIASVLEEGSLLSTSVFPSYPGIMAGDQVDFPVFHITRVQEITPELVLPYFKVFADPQPAPQNYELSEEGKKVLSEAVQVFAKEQSGLLLIKGFTDRSGRPDQNQIESYQRALTVRQYLASELGFDEQRMIALGLGEQDPIDRSRVSSYEKYNRRIEMKVVPVPR